LTHLSSLELGPTRVTDAGLAVLERATSIRSVRLHQTEAVEEERAGDAPRITDAGLARLADHPSLNSLGLAGTQWTEAGIVRFQQKSRRRLQVSLGPRVQRP
jgi:hypothetical protein